MKRTIYIVKKQQNQTSSVKKNSAKDVIRLIDFCKI